MQCLRIGTKWIRFLVSLHLLARQKENYTPIVCCETNFLHFAVCVSKRYDET